MYSPRPMPDDTAATLAGMLGVAPWDVVDTVDRLTGGNPVDRPEPSHLSCDSEITRLRGLLADTERRLAEQRAVVASLLADDHPKPVRTEPDVALANRIAALAPDDGPYRRYVAMALRAGRRWALTVDEFNAVRDGPCLCGAVTGHAQRRIGGGLGLVDPSGGWEPGNVVRRCGPTCTTPKD